MVTKEAKMHYRIFHERKLIFMKLIVMHDVRKFHHESPCDYRMGGQFISSIKLINLHSTNGYQSVDSGVTSFHLYKFLSNSRLDLRIFVTNGLNRPKYMEHIQLLLIQSWVLT